MLLQHHLRGDPEPVETHATMAASWPTTTTTTSTPSRRRQRRRCDWAGATAAHVCTLAGPRTSPRRLPTTFKSSMHNRSVLDLFWTHHPTTGYRCTPHQDGHPPMGGVRHAVLHDSLSIKFPGDQAGTPACLCARHVEAQRLALRRLLFLFPSLSYSPPRILPTDIPAAPPPRRRCRE